ncbi:uncharacterized protein Bfra_010456 [Botrytis fragariae]|uniref:Uncharacterized protein n=1 Tax=Botrytis fragariae TaxID=1964551 RepID=A0A8H6ECE0_9HELO|nr:uncharacterized protein Bfra_010456 [Botrytis fragariae]KAF5867482.1 hypothetical protein Bfra_010456 [Botrytis fragariae]
MLMLKPNNKNRPFPKGLISDTLTPDPIITVQEIEDSAYDTKQLLDHEKLLPGQFNLGPNFVPSFADQVEVLNNHVAAARISMTGEVGLNQDFFDTEPNFINLKTAIRGVSNARRANFSKHKLGQLFTNWRSQGITPVCKTVVAVDSTPYFDIDTAMTISGSANSAIDAKTVVDRIMAGVGPLVQDKTVRNHAAVISRLDQWTSDLNAPC